MYDVAVCDSVTGTVCDREKFAFGQWKEIGYWLDNFGYNDPDYVVKIAFIETA